VTKLELGNFYGCGYWGNKMAGESRKEIFTKDEDGTFE
jgi:hypothetical protein